MSISFVFVIVIRRVTDVRRRQVRFIIVWGTKKKPAITAGRCKPPSGVQGRSPEKILFFSSFESCIWPYFVTFLLKKRAYNYSGRCDRTQCTPPSYAPAFCCGWETVWRCCSVKSPLGAAICLISIRLESVYKRKSD